MSRPVAPALFVFGTVLLLGSGEARAQPVTPAATEPATTAAPANTAEVGAEQGGARRLLGDIGRDYLNFISWETAGWLAGGGISALAVHVVDDELREATQDPEAPVVRTLETGEVGATYGNLTLQVPLAVGWWIVGHAAGSPREADAGRDLLRAQITALGYTYAFKYAADRTRPNGDPRSFPSGHATAVFATAMVLQEHYGWKVGVPVFAAATFTAASRITVNKHWASDVVFGAALGMASARTVTIHLRQRSLALGPLSVPGGGGIAVRVTDRASHDTGSARRAGSVNVGRRRPSELSPLHLPAGASGSLPGCAR